MNDKTLQRILAAFVFLVALATYLITMAPTMSFWDCGEFLASASILGNPIRLETPCSCCWARYSCSPCR